MAAVPEGSGTRFAVLGAHRGRWSAPLWKALRPVGHARGLRMIDRASRRALARREGRG
ncbi:hypothetical protein G3I32_21505 [Streptomyces coelicoflavus]|uniref:Uncharacterized protein n=1 Tax=Streptomyces coelicoflavus TaxID=285562 RepID=A0A7K3PN49_9ACTN|nr:hypothetical protein [Streptomyces coelicoflavus]NEB11384.1 hypothetical protein [Streptomyces coelicoflavus]